MNEEQRGLWGDYIRDLANRLGLRDWCLHLMHRPPDDEQALASVQRTYGRKHAQIFLCEDWTEMHQEVQRAAVVHELLHVQQAFLNTYVSHSVPQAMSRREYDIWWEGYRQHEEYVVDGLADNIALLLPMPPPGAEHGTKDPPPSERTPE